MEERLQFVQADVTKKEDLHKIVEEAISRFGKIDFLVNNAGPYVFERKKLVDYEEDEWNEMIQGNLTAVFHLLKLVVPIMRNRTLAVLLITDFKGRIAHRDGLSFSFCRSESRTCFINENSGLQKKLNMVLLQTWYVLVILLVK